MVTEYARSMQGFAVEKVDEIVRLDWSQVLSAEASNAGSMVTRIERLDGDVHNTRLAQVLDVEKILRDVLPGEETVITRETVGAAFSLLPSTQVLRPTIRLWRAC